MDEASFEASLSAIKTFLSSLPFPFTGTYSHMHTPTDLCNEYRKPVLEREYFCGRVLVNYSLD